MVSLFSIKPLKTDSFLTLNNSKVKDDRVIAEPGGDSGSKGIRCLEEEVIAKAAPSPGSEVSRCPADRPCPSRLPILHCLCIGRFYLSQAFHSLCRVRLDLSSHMNRSRERPLCIFNLRIFNILLTQLELIQNFIT